MCNIRKESASALPVSGGVESALPVDKVPIMQINVKTTHAEENIPSLF